VKTWNRTSLLTGVLAGITAALLSMGANTQSSLAIVLYAASALPILIAGLGWGNAAAIAAIVVAGGAAVALVSPYFALLIVVVTLVPAGWLSHLSNLARPASELGGPEGSLAWYPLSDILVHLAGLVTVGMVIVGYIVGYDSSVSDIMVDMVIEAVKAQEPLYNPDAAAIAQLKSIFTLALPLVQGAIWVLMLFAAYYLATPHRTAIRQGASAAGGRSLVAQNAPQRHLRFSRRPGPHLLRRCAGCDRCARLRHLRRRLPALGLRLLPFSHARQVLAASRAVDRIPVGIRLHDSGFLLPPVRPDRYAPRHRTHAHGKKN
jgi:hypothetical protein